MKHLKMENLTTHKVCEMKFVPVFSDGLWSDHNYMEASRELMRSETALQMQFEMICDDIGGILHPVHQCM